MDNKTNSFDLSIIVLTYNPILDKIIFTLNSLIKQKEIKFEIIISDDGSSNNLFDEIEKYMKDNRFKNYKLIKHDINQGTVLNLYDGIINCNGKYIKTISPGDSIDGDFLLSDWIKNMKKNKRLWSFSDCTYYKINENHDICIVPSMNAPKKVNVYKQKKNKKCRWNYLVFNDIVLGASTLCEQKTLKKYVSKIKEKVIYAEDNCYRLMMFDNIMPYYYEKKAILYEVGCGISTSGKKKWKQLLLNDWNRTNDIIINTERTDRFQRKIVKIYKKRKNKIYRKIH